MIDKTKDDTVAAARRIHNPGPAMPLASDSAKTVAEKARAPISERKARNTNWRRPTIYDREEGPRDVLRAILPQVKHWRAIETVNALHHRLGEIAGGFTVSAVQGYWQGVMETMVVYEVSFPSDSGRSFAVLAELEAAFIDAGNALGETWLHIEHHPGAFMARHVKVRKDHVETA